jgi:hypothetical protein
MPSFANLPPEKLTALVNFLASLKNAQGKQQIQTESGASPEGG